MKKICIFIVFLGLVGCGDTDTETPDVNPGACLGATITGDLSLTPYEIPDLKNLQSIKLRSVKSVTDGSVSYAVDATCAAGDLTYEESIEEVDCILDYEFNHYDIICEPKFFYTAKNLDDDGKLKIINLRNAFTASVGNTFKVFKNDVEVLSSDTDTETLAGKIRVNSDLGDRLEIATRNYDLNLDDNDEVCFEILSEGREHCYFHSKPEGAGLAASSLLHDVEDTEVSLLSSSEYTNLNDIGVEQPATVNSIDKKGASASRDYLELNHQGVYFNLDQSLVDSQLYNLSLELNSADASSQAAVFIYRRSEFDFDRYQKNFLKKFSLGVADSSLRQKRVSIDFVVNSLQQATELTVLVYGEGKILVRDLKISKIENSTAVDHSVFLSSKPNRDGFSTNSIPAKFVPHGLVGGYGYGNFKIDSNLEKYEIYVNYEDRYKTTQAHLYEKSSVTGDSLMGWNFRGANDSTPGEDSTDFLHGTGFIGTGWSPVKSDPDDYLVMLHSEGGKFATDGSFELIPFNLFTHETSEGGVLEDGIATGRFNNRVPRALPVRTLQEQNTNDPAAPVIAPVDALDYYLDQDGSILTEDDGFGGAQLSSYSNFRGYDLSTQYLFYLNDDQGLTYDSGGPEGAIAGVLHPQISYLEFETANTLTENTDPDLDGVSNYVEYITGTNPNSIISFTDFTATDLTIDDTFTFKMVNIPISKEAKNFNILVYEENHDGVETLIWSFDRGRGIESSVIYNITEEENRFIVEILSTAETTDIADLRVVFE